MSNLLVTTEIKMCSMHEEDQKYRSAILLKQIGYLICWAPDPGQFQPLASGAPA